MVIIIPRALGGTLILTVTPPPASALPTLIMVATFRDGKQTALYRDGKTTAGGR